MSKKFLYFFDQYQKKSLLLLFCFMSITTILEMIGLGFIFSIVGALGSKNITNNLFINKLSGFFALDKHHHDEQNKNQIELNKHQHNHKDKKHKHSHHHSDNDNHAHPE